MRRPQDEQRLTEPTDCNAVRVNHSWRRDLLHRDRSSPFDDIVIYGRRLVFCSPFKIAVIYHGVKANGNAFETKSNICHSDTCVDVSNVCESCRETRSVLVMITSSSMGIPEFEKEATSCNWTGLVDEVAIRSRNPRSGDSNALWRYHDTSTGTGGGIMQRGAHLPF